MEHPTSIFLTLLLFALLIFMFKHFKDCAYEVGKMAMGGIPIRSEDLKELRWLAIGLVVIFALNVGYFVYNFNRF